MGENYCFLISTIFKFNFFFQPPFSFLFSCTGTINQHVTSALLVPTLKLSSVVVLTPWPPHSLKQNCKVDKICLSGNFLFLSSTKLLLCPFKLVRGHAYKYSCLNWVTNLCFGKGTWWTKQLNGQVILSLGAGARECVLQILWAEGLFCRLPLKFTWEALRWAVGLSELGVQGGGLSVHVMLQIWGSTTWGAVGASILLSPAGSPSCWETSWGSQAGLRGDGESNSSHRP